MRALRKARGNALLISVVALAVLMVLVVGAIRFTGTNRVSATSKLNADRVAACADVARRTLLAKLRSKSLAVKDLKLDDKIPDNPTVAKQTRILAGHYGATAQEATIVEISGATMSEAKDQVQGIGNKLLDSPTLGGQYFRVVVLCKEASPSERESELEFVFRYGI